MKRTSLALLLVLPFAAAGLGCTSVGTAQERDELRVQNVQLHRDLDDSRAAQDVLHSDNSKLLAQIKALQTENANLRDQLNGIKTAPVATAKNDEFKGINNIETENDGKKVTVRIQGDVLFPAGKADLKDSSQKTLDQVAKVIQDKYAGHAVRVAGYTDADPITRSGWKDNLELSCARACAVVRQLDKNGVPSTIMYAAGFGEHQPRESKAKSRRVEIVVELH